MDLIPPPLAHRPIRRKSDSCVQEARRAVASDGTGGKGHWQQRIEREVGEGLGDAGAAEFGYLLLVAVFVMKAVLVWTVLMTLFFFFFNARLFKYSRLVLFDLSLYVLDLRRIFRVHPNIIRSMRLARIKMRNFQDGDNEQEQGCG